MPIVTKPVHRTDWNQLKSSLLHLSDLQLHSSIGVQVDILLGLDHSQLMVVMEARLGKKFTRTPLGWIVRGVVGVDLKTQAQTHTAFTYRLHQ